MKFNFHSLLKDELTYEVTIRSETPESTVLGLRKQLRSLLLECPACEIVETDLKIESEILIIAEKLRILENLIVKAESSDKRSFSRPKALATHLFWRISRIQTEDPALSLEKSKLNRSLSKLWSKLEQFFQQSEESFEDASEIEEVLDIKEIPVPRAADVLKWGLRFNGLTDPRAFIENIEQHQRAFGVSDSKIFQSVGLLFTDQASLWFKGIVKTVNSWGELKSLLLEEFSPVDFDYRLKSEIRSRTQGVDEPVHIYFSVMLGMFNRLSVSFAEGEKLEILLHNIRPSYTKQLALIQVNSVEELKNVCRKLEAAELKSALFVEPGKPVNSVVGAEFAYKGKAKGDISVVAQNISKQESSFSNFGRHRNNKGEKSGLNSANSTNFKCYKCGDNTYHNVRFCRGSARNEPIKCFSCGELGFTVRSCPKCRNISTSKN